MANPIKGEVEFEVEGETYILVLDFNSLCTLEDKLDLSVAEIASRLKGNMRGGFIRAVLWAGLQRHQPDLTEEDVGTMIGEMGMPAAVALVVDGFIKAFPSAEVADAPPGPPAAPQKRRRRPGISAATSQPGAV